MDARERYRAACHAMQSGVAMQMHRNAAETSPKHLRVGVNSAMVEHSALVKLLIDKGVITIPEFEEELATAMEEEVARYEKKLGESLGANVRLG